MLPLIGCSEEPEYNNTSEPEKEYYVKYEATVTSVYLTNNITYTVNTERGIQTFKSGKSFSQTFGPFEKGFKASINVDATNLDQASTDAKIYVCRGSEPFALKANNTGGKQVSISYTIDY